MTDELDPQTQECLKARALHTDEDVLDQYFGDTDDLDLGDSEPSSE
eukprot:CAMPEP_0170494280 /NCGR_PEP_ID=MMETSP0208-20121228/14551_1 /TAXON_ID=197538 /ORGANISM="Strombidium inclinatum, Strain S3" /LENGTH=45 /DNA_ID= /DNA_START= /DNA_END= /DNA_ORIENTATION=